MPSPVAHSLAGLAVAHFALRHRAVTPLVQHLSKISNSHLERIFWFVALVFGANAADLDFLPGLWIGDPNKFHHGITHTLIAAVIFGLLATALAAVAGFRQWRRFGLLMGVSYGTHLILDAVTLGLKEPYGIRLLRPFSSKPFMTPFHLFLDIRRDPGGTFFWSLLQWHNVEAVILELSVMVLGWAAYRVIRSLASS